MKCVNDTGCGGLGYSDVVRTLALRQKFCRCFWAVGRCRQSVTWQLLCHSAQECADHDMRLTVHLSHPKHDWFDCGVCWSDPLSDLLSDQLESMGLPATCRWEAFLCPVLHIVPLCVVPDMKRQQIHPSVEATHCMTYYSKVLPEKSHIFMKSKHKISDGFYKLVCNSHTMKTLFDPSAWLFSS